jgi:hypothetical protein
MHDIEREAMDMQLKDKLLEYKQKMGLLGEGAGTSSKQIAGSSQTSESEVLDEVLKKEESSTQGS